MCDVEHFNTSARYVMTNLFMRLWLPPIILEAMLKDPPAGRTSGITMLL